ncbi:MAG: thioredoxin family protein [Deltaproteobacteria bacterium]|nr:thioredoxin family protein [Deltaproteobacteria bacterium]
MALTKSTQSLFLGQKAPDFRLPDVVSARILGLSEIKSKKGTVVMFICNHCPYVKHVRDELVKLSQEYIQKGIAFVGINSNDVENYPEDSPKKMKEHAKQYGYPFAYLFDETQEVAHAYDAACTPDFYVFDKDLKCVYRGRMDDSTPGSGKPVTGQDLKAALDAILSGKQVSEDQKPSLGCNIKWK